MSAGIFLTLGAGCFVPCLSGFPFLFLNLRQTRSEKEASLLGAKKKEWEGRSAFSSTEIWPGLREGGYFNFNVIGERPNDFVGIEPTLLRPFLHRPLSSNQNPRLSEY